MGQNNASNQGTIQGTLPRVHHQGHTTRDITLCGITAAWYPLWRYRFKLPARQPSMVTNFDALAVTIVRLEGVNCHFIV